MISQEVFVCASKGSAAKHTSSRATHDFFMVEVSSRKVLFLRRHTQAAEHIEMMPIAVFGMADVRCGTNGSNVVLAGTARWAQKIGQRSYYACVIVTTSQYQSQLGKSGHKCSQ